MNRSSGIRLRVLGAAALSLALAPALARSGNEARRVVFRTQTMGTWATLSLVTADSAAVADVAYAALRVFHRVDSLMSNWTDASEVARINREAARSEVAVHPEVADVIAFAQQVAEESGGAFDITVEPLVRLWGFLGGTPRVPAQREIDAVLDRVGADKVRFDARAATLRFTRDDVRIDLGGIAKGYGADGVAAVLRRGGVADALVDLSGNMVALGSAATHEGWTVGIRDPSGALPYLARLDLHDEAVATSGDYEQFVAADGRRHGHIIDPRTGWSARGLSSVTVVTHRAMAADAWATALFVLGPEEARRVARERDDLAVVLVEPQSGGGVIVWVEERLRPRFQAEDVAPGTLTVRYF
ncbi:MAG: FAD:protein FMN transferase [Candidatus Krumholzibacteria bacterium]|nr:FAD:protein FMN transferase [Candidatus Krumholzibacteria bacterium]